MKKTVTLKMIGYWITGIADLTMWGGGNGCIEMKPFETKSRSKKALLAGINDNGFGVQSINGAICDIYELYENGYKEHLESGVTVGKVSDDTDFYYMKQN